MILVAGPPCAGKTTYVRDRAAPGERIVDYDDIIEELGGQRYGAPSPKAKGIWLERVPTAHWLIWTAPLRWQRGMIRERYGAEVRVLLPTQAECLIRAAAERPPHWQDWVRAWYAAWEPSRSGREVIV